MDANQMMTFGDVRRMIIDTIVQIKEEKIDVSRGMAIAANMKVLNDNIQVEINAAKLALATDGKAHNFGRVVGMGQRLIGNDASQSS
jgi:hypothetical protein